MELKFTDITVHVKLDEKTFRHFACFDLFVRRKKWILPAVSALVLLALALAALLVRKEHSGIIAAGLLAAGIVLPLVYSGVLLARVKGQAARANLEPARAVYTVTLREDGVTVENEGEKEKPRETSWGSVQKAFRKKGCVYLYLTAREAFLLPAKQADAPDHEVWAFIRDHLGDKKCKG